MDNLYFDKQADMEQWGKRLPHLHQDGKYVFITFRLNDSLPQSFIKDYSIRKTEWLKRNPKPWTKEQRTEYFNLFHNSIEKKIDQGYGSCILANKDVADAMEKVINELEGELYYIESYVIMSNHIHMLLVLDSVKVDKVVWEIKSRSSHIFKQIVNIEGEIWNRKYYDRIIRNSNHLSKVKEYILKNFYQSGLKARYLQR